MAQVAPISPTAPVPPQNLDAEESVLGALSPGAIGAVSEVLSPGDKAEPHKVLVVDDESNMRFLLRMVFESEGFEVVEAHHGAAALERVKEEEPDLVVTDLMMPVMNGRELIERLHADAETAGIPILVLSANANAELAGADAALRKPFDIDALLDTARSLSRKDAA